MQKESRVKKTMLNAKINLICYFASFITAFFTRKILLDHLGAEFIGFTGTVGSLLSFLNLAELGIGTAIGYVPMPSSARFKNDSRLPTVPVKPMNSVPRWSSSILRVKNAVMNDAK